METPKNDSTVPEKPEAASPAEVIELLEDEIWNIETEYKYKLIDLGRELFAKLESVRGKIRKLQDGIGIRDLKSAMERFNCDEDLLTEYAVGSALAYLDGWTHEEVSAETYRDREEALAALREEAENVSGSFHKKFRLVVRHPMWTFGKWISEKQFKANRRKAKAVK